MGCVRETPHIKMKPARDVSEKTIERSSICVTETPCIKTECNSGCVKETPNIKTKSARDV